MSLWYVCVMAPLHSSSWSDALSLSLCMRKSVGGVKYLPRIPHCGPSPGYGSKCETARTSISSRQCAGLLPSPHQADMSGEASNSSACEASARGDPPVLAPDFFDRELVGHSNLHLCGTPSTGIRGVDSASLGRASASSAGELAAAG